MIKFSNFPAMAKLAFFLVFLSIISCKEKESVISNVIAEDLAGKKIKLEDYISAKPAKILSSRSLIELEFSQPMVLNHVIGYNLENNPISFSPEIKGTAKWITPHILQITPEQPMPNGQQIKGTLYGKTAFGKFADVDNYEFEFQVIPNEILEIRGNFEPAQNKINTARLELEMIFSERPDIEKLKKDINLNLAFDLLADEVNGKNGSNGIIGASGKIKLISEEIPRTNKEQTATIKLSKNWTISNEEFVKKFTLAAKNNFKIVSDNEQASGGEEKNYEFTFSDPISTKGDVSGFVSIEPAIKYNVSVRGRTLRVKGQFKSGTKYAIRIKGGLPSDYETKLSSDFLRTVFFNNEIPQVKWLGGGVFLPLENNNMLQFQTMNAAKASLEIREILPQNVNFFLQKNSLNSSDRYFSNVEETAKIIYSGKLSLKEAPRDKWYKSEIDLSSKINKKAGAAYLAKLSFKKKDLIAPCKMNADEANEGDLVFETANSWTNPCSEYYYLYEGEAEKFFVISSIALTAKKSKDGISVWATDIATAKPISGLTLELNSYINEVVEKQKTNADGYAFFNLKNKTVKSEEQNGSKQNYRDRGSRGFSIHGANERGFALLRLEDENWETSRFDVGGVAETGNAAKFFGYTERGVYRPGDTIHFSGMLREGISKPLGNLPVLISVMNPQGSVVNEQFGTTTDNGLVSFDIPTKLESPTGYWVVEVKNGGNVWKYDLRVETVKPNRLKNSFDLPSKLSGQNPKLNGTFQSKYLFGAPANGLSANIDMHIENKNLNFTRYPNFIFSNPAVYFDGIGQTLFNGNLDSEGQVKVEATLNLKGNKIPEAANIRINARVEEKGGGYTYSNYSIPFSPYSAYVGLQKKDSWASSKIGDTLKVPFIVLDEKGKAVSGRDLRVKVYQNRRFSWWEGDRERWDFRTKNATFIIHDGNLTSGESVKEFAFVPQEEGQLLIEITDVGASQIAGHSAAQFVYASSWGYGGTDLNKIPEASHISIASDRKVYRSGDSLRLSFESPNEGRALISIERNNDILISKWISAKAGLNIASFAITENMIPNVYAVVSLIQPMKAVEGEKPLRLYGVLPITVEKEGVDLKLAMEVPKEIKSEEEFTIIVKNESKENASFTLAVVDEGLLNLTNFKMPNPKNFFFKKQALNLKTLDNLDQIIGSLLPNMDAHFSIGGDFENENAAINPRERRFNAVSLFSGIKSVDAGKTQKITFKMPNYIGSVRAQLVAVSKNAFAEKNSAIVVKKPLMILPTAPRVAKPDDKFEIPVSIFAMDEKIKNVKVSINVSKELKIIGSSEFNLKFNSVGVMANGNGNWKEQDGKFFVEAQPAIGAAKIIVKAEGNGFKSSDTINLPILSQSQSITNTKEATINAGEEWKGEVNFFGLDGTNSAELILRTMPSFNISNRINYLINYPYGCLEQTVSAAFPQIYMEQLVQLNDNKKQEISVNINAAIERLREFSLPEGFSYWAGNGGNADSWSTSYAGHFLLEAKKQGYSVPQKLLDSWKNWELSQVKNTYAKNFRYQAYRLYLLALANNPQIGAMNLLKENYLNSLDFLSKHLLAGAYNLAGQKKVAEEVLNAKGNALANYRELSGTFGSDLRDQAMAVVVLANMNKLSNAQRIYADFVKKWNEQNWWSTQESSFALLAYSTLAQNIKSGDVEAELNGKKIIVSNKKPFSVSLGKGDVTGGIKGNEVSVKSKNGTIFAELQTKGIPLKDSLSTSSNGLSIARTLYDLQGNVIYPHQIRQGEPFYVVISAQNNSGVRLQELALSSLFPSGFEIVNENNSARFLKNIQLENLKNIRLANYDYMDIRDDRVNWFFSLGIGETANFAVQIHPSYKGVFHWSALTLDAMYSPNYFARLAGFDVEVK